jgi:hypothetical protein
MKLTGPYTTIDLRLVAVAGALVLCGGAPLQAQSAECASSFAASSKLYDKPFHLYPIDSAETDARLHGGRPTVSESIWTGTVDYVLVRGKWMWRIHSVSEVGVSDTDIWVSRSSGLPLKSDAHQDVGSALGKSHIVSRYEYANVRPPAGVQ